MKLFIAGDYHSGTGPANVTQNILNIMPSGTLYLKHRNKILRAIEIFFKTLYASAIVYSGFSAQVLLGIKIAHICHKNVYYLMHGSIWYENQINQVSNFRMETQENKILISCDYILAVSKQFENWLKQTYPQLSAKIYHITNGIDWNLICSPTNNICKKNNQILSIGGGMPRKNIITLCEAISQIYQKQPDCNIHLIILGADGKDSEQIRKYPFVKDMGILSKDNTLKIMQESELYIQNSLFETFGLAPIEALLCGCNLLLSRHVGALSVLSGLEDNDLIEDPNDINELEYKIIYNLHSSNHQRILESIKKEETSIQYRGGELIELIKKLEGNKTL